MKLKLKSLARYLFLKNEKGKGEGRWQLIGSGRNYLTKVEATKINRIVIRKKGGGNSFKSFCCCKLNPHRNSPDSLQSPGELQGGEVPWEMSCLSLLGACCRGPKKWINSLQSTVHSLLPPDSNGTEPCFRDAKCEGKVLLLQAPFTFLPRCTCL